jgi:serine/threonine-protein kinase
MPTPVVGNEPTRVYSEPAPAAPALGPSVEFVTGPDLAISSEIGLLLRRRLRAVAICLAVVTTILLARSVAFWILSAHSFPGLVEVTAILGYGALFALLASPVYLSLRQLRFVEWAIFGLSGASLVVAQQRFVDSHVGEGQAIGLGLFVMSYVLLWYGLLAVYVLLIPSTWRRSAAMVAILAATPVLLICVERAQYDRMREVFDPAALALVTVLMVSGAGATLFGIHTIGSLRRAALEARRFGQYRLKNRLGAGGMGEVYLAEHVLLKRPCAIKLIHANRATDAVAIARFEQEVRTAAELTHVNTIDIFDYGCTADGTLYYVMEFLPGPTLAQLVEQYGPQPAARVICLLRQVCGALREAHLRGLVHRDIKPANMIITEQGGVLDFVKLLDFGLVKPIDRGNRALMTQENVIAGSPQFMSPEQALGHHELDPRSDMYSLGAVAYFLLTGQPPFSGSSAMELLVAHARDDVVPPSRVVASVPADLERVVLRSMAKERNARYQTAEDLESALAGCQCAGAWTQDHAAAWWQKTTAEKDPSPASPSVDDGQNEQIRYDGGVVNIRAKKLI